MRYLLSGSAVIFILIPLLFFGQNSDFSKNTQNLINKTGSHYFIENKGQWPAEVRFLAKTGGMNAWITNSGVVYDYYKIIRNYNADEISKMPGNEQQNFKLKHTGSKGHIVALNLEGINEGAKSVPSGVNKGYFNYIKGNSAAKTSYVKQFSEVIIENIYDGIDVRYYFENGLLRYDYIVKPGADLAQINIKIEGSDGYQINEKGELRLQTTLGAILHGKLYAYQQPDHTTREVGCSFVKTPDGKINLRADKYDPALALVIDPLVFATFIGGSGEEYCASMTLDIYGNSYITGYTRSTDYPVSTGAYDNSYNLGSDIFVTKINEPGNAMVYSTYISADSNEAGNSIAVDRNGNAYIAGYTQSANYPTTLGAFDTSYNGGSNFGGDAFITKLNSAGNDIIYSTFIGGISNDNAFSITLDQNENAYITGYSKSADYPTTTGAFATTLNGTNTDVIVTKINAAGSALIYSTFIGGANEDVGNSIAVDTNGNSYVTGYTTSSNYPTVLGSFKTSFNGGFQDAFVTKLNPAGTALTYSTYLGGNSLDAGAGITVDISGNTYITGYTISPDFPITAGVYDFSTNGVVWDAFVTKLNPLGKALIYSTFIGGDNEDQGYTIITDAKGNAFIAGKTLSASFPTTVGAFDRSYNGGSGFGADGFLTVLNPTATALIYSTFFGGTDEDFCTGIALDAIGSAFFAGNTMSADFPVTSGVYDESQNGDYDAFVSCIFFPVKQATSVSFKNITGIKADISWVKGTGSKRAVFVKEATYGLAKPLTDVFYGANDTFGRGAQIDTSGWYCIYNDTGTSVIATGFNQLTTYRVMVCEYIGMAGNEHYNIDSVNKNPANFTTIFATPTIQATDIFFSNFTDTSFTITFTKGNGTKRAAFMKIDSVGKASPINNTTYNAKSVFGQGSQIGFSGWFCVYNDTGSSVTVRKLMAGKTYRVMVCEFNGIPSKEQYLSDISVVNPANQLVSFLKPSVQASNIIFANVTKTSVNMSYTRGNGSACLLLMTTGTTPYPPLKNNTTYTVNSEIGTSGWFCKYKGSLKTFSLTGLAQDTFRIMVCEYNGTPGFEVYNTDTANKNPNSFTTVLIGINDNGKSDIGIYPNPTSGQFVLENANGCSVSVYNTLGLKVYSSVVNEDDFIIILFGQKDGIYFVKLEKKGILISKKLILKR